MLNFPFDASFKTASSQASTVTSKFKSGLEQSQTYQFFGMRTQKSNCFPFISKERYHFVDVDVVWYGPRTWFLQSNLKFIPALNRVAKIHDFFFNNLFELFRTRFKYRYNVQNNQNLFFLIKNTGLAVALHGVDGIFVLLEEAIHVSPVRVSSVVTWNYFFFHY